jgi:type IV secretory pathway VirB6-like protein
MTDSFIDSWLGVTIGAVLLGTLLAEAWIWLG